MRGIAAALVLLVAVVVLVGAGYLIGVAKGKGLARRWAPIVQAGLRWRRLELQDGYSHAADLELQNIRGLLDQEELRRDKRYVEVEDR